eukprot:2410870-Prymnesium_polylepis.1
MVQSGHTGAFGLVRSGQRRPGAFGSLRASAPRIWFGRLRPGLVRAASPRFGWVYASAPRFGSGSIAQILLFLELSMHVPPFCPFGS